MLRLSHNHGALRLSTTASVRECVRACVCVCVRVYIYIYIYVCVCMCVCERVRVCDIRFGMSYVHCDTLNEILLMVSCSAIPFRLLLYVPCKHIP